MIISELLGDCSALQLARTGRLKFGLGGVQNVGQHGRLQKVDTACVILHRFENFTFIASLWSTSACV